MASTFYKSWWREMGAISRGMMFIEGNLSTPAALEDAPSAVGQTGVASVQASPISVVLRKKTERLYRNFLFLGGRPVSPGHHDDIDEPFPQIEEDEPAPRTRFALPQHTKTTQPQTCATC